MTDNAGGRGDSTQSLCHRDLDDDGLSCHLPVDHDGPCDGYPERSDLAVRRVVEQALYEAEVVGLLRSAGRQQIAERVVEALTARCSQTRECFARRHDLGCPSGPPPATPNRRRSEP